VYFLGKAFANRTFAEIDSLEQLDRLRIHPWCNQRLTWKELMLDMPIFRRSVVGVDGVEISPTETLRDSTLRPWVKKVGEAFLLLFP
jgi:Protein of unknown function (DUF3435)